MLLFLLILWLVFYNITLSRNNGKQIKRIHQKIKIIYYEQEKSESKETEKEGSDTGEPAR